MESGAKMKIFKVVYQDRALNKTAVELKAPCWADVIPMAFSHKKAEEKLLTIECVGEVQ